jgi:hypothetical protein
MFIGAVVVLVVILIIVLKLTKSGSNKSAYDRMKNEKDWVLVVGEKAFPKDAIRSIFTFSDNDSVLTVEMASRMDLQTGELLPEEDADIIMDETVYNITIASNGDVSGISDGNSLTFSAHGKHSIKLVSPLEPGFGIFTPAKYTTPMTDDDLNNYFSSIV